MSQAPLIMLAEDNRDSIGMLVDYLGSKGYRLVVATTGVEALARLEEEQPSLVLMDIQMPVMDGLEAIGCMRADSRYADIPIIALTAMAMVGDRERCLAAGASDYLSKPVSLRYLASQIAHHITQGRGIAQ